MEGRRYFYYIHFASSHLSLTAAAAAAAGRHLMKRRAAGSRCHFPIFPLAVLSSVMLHHFPLGRHYLLPLLHPGEFGGSTRSNIPQILQSQNPFNDVYERHVKRRSIDFEAL